MKYEKPTECRTITEALVLMDFIVSDLVNMISDIKNCNQEPAVNPVVVRINEDCIAEQIKRSSYDLV